MVKSNGGNTISFGLEFTLISSKEGATPRDANMYAREMYLLSALTTLLDYIDPGEGCNSDKVVRGEVWYSKYIVKQSDDHSKLIYRILS
jgi:hypothetical protein